MHATSTPRSSSFSHSTAVHCYLRAIRHDARDTHIFHPHPWIHRFTQRAHDAHSATTVSDASTPHQSPSLAAPALAPLFSAARSQSQSSPRPYFAHMDEFDDDPTVPYHVSMIAGASAGVMEHLCMFPIDTIKTRMQALTPANVPSYNSLPSSVLRVAREEGLLRLYRGVNAAVVGAIPSHAANYAVYEYFKDRFGGNQPGHHFAANAAAGALATASHDAVITPLDVVKQRLQLVNSPYTGVLDCIRRTLRTEGISAFYASYPTTVLMNIPFMAVHFAGYESFKLLLTGNERADDHGIAEELVAGAGAGACAGFVSTPLDVVKTRIQTQLIGNEAVAPRLGALDVCRVIWREAGFRGFTRGASARVLYYVPSAAICWTTYETVKRALKD